MEIQEAQRIVDEWIRTVGKGYFSELTNMALLTEETGELARIIARTYGDQRPKASELPDGLDQRAASPEELRAALAPRLAEEMADVLWVLLCLANQTGIDLTTALLASIRKKTLRDADRFA